MLEDKDIELINRALDEKLDSQEQALLVDLLATNSEAQALHQDLTRIALLLQNAPKSALPWDIATKINTHLSRPVVLPGRQFEQHQRSPFSQIPRLRDRREPDRFVRRTRRRHFAGGLRLDGGATGDCRPGLARRRTFKTIASPLFSCLRSGTWMSIHPPKEAPCKLQERACRLA